MHESYSKRKKRKGMVFKREVLGGPFASYSPRITYDRIRKRKLARILRYLKSVIDRIGGQSTCLLCSCAGSAQNL